MEKILQSVGRMDLVFAIVGALSQGEALLAGASDENPVSLPPIKIHSHGKVYDLTLTLSAEGGQVYDAEKAHLAPLHPVFIPRL